MPLQHSSDEAVETVAAYGVPAQEAAPEVSEPNHDAPRYDTEAVKEILARAEAMQAHHRATLTPDAIIALGQEVGVEPEFVKRALAQTEAKAPALVTHPSVRQRTRRKQIVLAGGTLTRNQRAAAFLPAALYLLFMPFLLKNLDISSNAAIGFYIVLPAVLAVFGGKATKSKMVGSLGGSLLGFASTCTLLIVTALNHRYLPSLGEFLLVLSVLSGSGAALGASSAFLCQLVSRSPRKRLRVRFVVESEEINDTPKSEWV